MILVDTGPLVAILHGDDQDHQRCVEVTQRVREPLLTTWPVITEAMYLLSFALKAQGDLLELIHRDAIQVVELSRSDMPRIRALMAKHRDLPMDFADATLVALAEREDLDLIFTLDYRDFGIYRIKGRRPFAIVP